MQHRPSYAEFVELARQGTVVPVYRQLIGDTLTPVSAFCKIQEGDWSFLFESVVGGERLGRYSFLGAGPFLRFQAFGNRVLLESISPGAHAGHATQLELNHPDPLALLEEKLAAYRTPPLAGLPRFSGGAVGYAGYDAVRYVERLPKPPLDDRQLPDLCFAFYDRMVIFDHINKTIAVVAHAHVDNGDLERGYQPGLRARRPPGGAFAPGRGRLAADRHRARRRGDYALSIEFRAGGVRGCRGAVPRNTSRPATSFRWSSVSVCRPRRGPGLSTFTGPCGWSIRARSCFTCSQGPLCLVGSSPEIMVRVEGDRVTIRPLAGTRPRGQTEEEDERLAAELFSRSQGAGRAHHAGRPGPQRRGPGGALRHACSSAT